MCSKPDRAKGPLCEDAVAFVFGDVEEGEVLGAVLAGDEVGEFADLHRSRTAEINGTWW